MQKEFEKLGFQTVEQVAHAPDTAFIRLMGGMSWRKKAMDFLLKAKNSESHQIKEQEEKINALKKEVLRMKESLAEAVQAELSRLKEEPKAPVKKKARSGLGDFVVIPN